MVNCCCTTTTPNPCNCTWPKVLTYSGSVAQAQAAIYFLNIYAGSGAEPSTYALTYQTRPAEIPSDLRLLYFSAPGGVHDPYYITMPASAWFSDPVPATIFGFATHVYFYGWFQSCRFNVMVIDAPYGQDTFGPDPTAARGAGNNVLSYTQKSCTPFQYWVGSGAVKLSGTHGSDDLTPNSSGSLGAYVNPRPGLPYSLSLLVRDPGTGATITTVHLGHTGTAELDLTVPTFGNEGGYTPPPGASVAWSSSNTGVFTVAALAGTGRATVTAVAAGSATLTAAISGDPDSTTTSATMTLTVAP